MSPTGAPALDTGATPAGRTRHATRLGRWSKGRLAVVLPPVVVGVVGITAWEGYVRAYHIQPYLLPAPSEIWTQFRHSFRVIVQTSRATGANAVVGLVVGLVAGLLGAVVAARSKIVDGLLGPLAAAMNAVPIIALAPLFNTMFSTTSAVPRRLVVAIVVFFPVFVNTVRGLRQVPDVQRELMRSLAVGPWRFARTVQLPGAVPYIFTGFRLASSLAVIAAVVSEYFGGRQNGLGSRITSAASNTAYPRAWAFVAAACVLGLAVYLVAGLLEWLATPWRRGGSAGWSRRGGSAGGRPAAAAAGSAAAAAGSAAAAAGPADGTTEQAAATDGRQRA